MDSKMSNSSLSVLVEPLNKGSSNDYVRIEKLHCCSTIEPFK